MIKNLFIITAAVLIFGACTKPENNRITIETNQHKDKLAYLIRYEGNSPIILDSAKWENGFIFKNESKIQEIAQVQWNGVTEKIAFFLDNGNITIKLKENATKIASIDGSVLNTKYIAYLDSSNVYADKNQEMYSNYKKAKTENDLKKLDDIKNQAELLYNKEQAFLKRTVDENMKNVLGLYILRSKIAYTLDYDGLKEFISKVPENNKTNPYYEYLSAQLDKLSKTRVGEIAPDFTMKDSTGNDISLKDFRGNYVMIDFWASWCRPCRNANPFIVELFKKYSPKGFQILGVSFDESKEDWLKAINSDKLTWSHVSDLQGWKNAAGQLYGIRSIPHTVLIDPDGKIIANKLDHEKLDKLLEDIYK